MEGWYNQLKASCMEYGQSNNWEENDDFIWVEEMIL